eukprot:2185008-Alexandrium_andersonii.AAC.1
MVAVSEKWPAQQHTQHAYVAQPAQCKPRAGRMQLPHRARRRILGDGSFIWALMALFHGPGPPGPRKSCDRRLKLATARSGSWSPYRVANQ